MLDAPLLPRRRAVALLLPRGFAGFVSAELGSEALLRDACDRDCAHLRPLPQGYRAYRPNSSYGGPSPVHAILAKVVSAMG